MYDCAQLCLFLNSSDELSNETPTKDGMVLQQQRKQQQQRQQPFKLEYMCCVRLNGISVQCEMRRNEMRIWCVQHLHVDNF